MAGDKRDLGSMVGLGRSSGGGHGNPLQYSCLENPIDRRAWQVAVHRAVKSRTHCKHTYIYIGASLVAQTVKRLPAMRETRVRFLGREGPLEKEMAIHSSTLAWKIPWMEDHDRL